MARTGDLSYGLEMQRPLQALALCFAVLGVWVPGAGAENRNTSLATNSYPDGSGDIRRGLRERQQAVWHTMREKPTDSGFADNDGAVDVYERFAGATYLISGRNDASATTTAPAAFGGASADGSRVFFTTTEKLVTADDDTATDVYQRSAGITTLISGGANGGAGVTYRGASADGSRVFFETSEKLDPVADQDGAADVYVASGGTFTLLSGEERARRTRSSGGRRRTAARCSSRQMRVSPASGTRTAPRTSTRARSAAAPP